MTKQDFTFRFWNMALYTELRKSGYDVKLEGRTCVLDYSECEGESLKKLKSVMDEYIPEGGANITKAM
jgi:hypothetical protein